MKKNKMMRIASVLLVAVLLSTCAISGTFAKYVTTSSGNDSARVAKWGFTSDASISFEDLFNDSDARVADGSNDTQNIIAPGTFGSVSFTFLSTGEPEVDYTFFVDTTESECSEFIKNNKNITWRLTTSQDQPTEWSPNDTWDNLIAQIKWLSGASEGIKEYKVGDEFPSIVNQTYYIHWNWSFSNDDDGNNNYNYNDSHLGNTAVANDHIVTVKITITATQID